MRTLKETAKLLKMLSQPLRLEILCALMREEKLCVCRIADALGVPQSTLSRNLAILRNGGFVEDSREGTMVFYRVSDERIPAIFKAVGLKCSQGSNGVQ